MNTEQRYDATASGATTPPPIGQAASPAPLAHSVEPITLIVSTGNQFHQLFFALVCAQRAALEEIVAEFDTNDIEGHVRAMHDLGDIEDLITQLVTSLNNNVIKLNDAYMTERVRTYLTEREQSEIAKWEKKTKNHPNRKPGL